LLGFAGITYFGYEKFIEIDPKLIILYFQLNGVSVTIAIFFGVMTFFSMSYIKIPKRWLIYFIIFLALAFMNFFFPLSGYSFINYIFFGMMVMEIVLSKFIKTERKNPKGGWIITVGLLVLSFFVVLQILIDYQIIQVSSNNNQVFVYGMVGFAISMSLFLSYNFAQINKSLEAQLIKVKELSEKTLEQERMANKLELERQKIEAENQRKTLELEAARKLQLSLLPKEIPHTKNYDIKFYMSTASEVGGDYYDILSDNKGQILIAVGDATGHGVSAGIIVSIVKGLLHQFRSDFNPSEILRKINDVLISMKISSVYMGLTLVKLDGSNAVYSSSGMPPVFHYHKITNQVEDIIIKRMPLGATDKLEFEERNFELISGDKLFLFSDGLSELFNNKKEMFEFDRIKESLIKNSDKSSADLISEINKEAKKWRNGIEQLDDMTLAVINYLDAK
jgi:serine phosphatase RsbU (regulator of sigma subunit)